MRTTLLTLALGIAFIIGCDDRSVPTDADAKAGTASPVAAFTPKPTNTSTTGIPMVVLGFDPAWTSSSASAINERGQVAGTCTTVLERACMWIDGRPIIVGKNDSGVHGMNARGQLVGIAPNTSNLLLWPALWERMGMTALGVLGGDRHGHAYDINDRGQVVGWTNPSSGERHAFLWEKGVMTSLGTLDNKSAAYAINNRGQVVGIGTTSGGDQAVMWYKGQLTGLGPSPSGGRWGPRAINNRGQIVGSSTADRAMLWDDGEITDLGTLGGPSAWANDINDRGQVVGSSTTESGERHAFLWEKGVMTDLGSLVLGGRSHAAEVNSRGQVAGVAVDASGRQMAVVWLPERASD